MLAAAICALVLTSGAAPRAVPALVDAPLLDYYSRALAASAEGETQKALGMLRLLLIPPGTELVPDYRNVPRDVRPAFERGVARAFALWQEALGSDFPYKMASSATGANVVTLTFVNQFTDRDGFHKGEIKTTRRIRWNRDMHHIEFDGTITISMYGFGNQFMTEEDITHITAHELGHSLGLGDAESLQRIMGPVSIGSPFARLTLDEVNAVREFRSLIRLQIEQISRPLSAGRR